MTTTARIASLLRVLAKVERRTALVRQIAGRTSQSRSACQHVRSLRAEIARLEGGDA